MRPKPECDSGCCFNNYTTFHEELCKICRDNTKKSKKNMNDAVDIIYNDLLEHGIQPEFYLDFINKHKRDIINLAKKIKEKKQ